MCGLPRPGRETFVPLAHPPGHAQVDFGEAVGVIGGVRCKIHFFCMDLPQSDACFVKEYPAETTEAFLDGHVSAFAFFGGVPLSVLYDNLKIAVAKINSDGRRDRTRAFTEKAYPVRTGINHIWCSRMTRVPSSVIEAEWPTFFPAVGKTTDRLRLRNSHRISQTTLRAPITWRRSVGAVASNVRVAAGTGPGDLRHGHGFGNAKAFLREMASSGELTVIIKFR